MSGANSDIMGVYLKHVFAQSPIATQSANSQMTIDSATKFEKNKQWIVYSLAKSIQLHFQSLQSTPQIAAILWQYMDDMNLVQTVFHYYPVYDC